MDWLNLITTFLLGFLFVLFWRKRGENDIIDWIFGYTFIFLGITMANYISINLWDLVIETLRKEAGL